MNNAERITKIKNRLRELTFGPDEAFDVNEVDLLVKELLEYDIAHDDNTDLK